jgi:hypothetical protein
MPSAFVPERKVRPFVELVMGSDLFESDDIP